MTEREKEIVQFQGLYSYISPQDLEEILETLEDKKYLNEEGRRFRNDFYGLFIKD